MREEVEIVLEKALVGVPQRQPRAVGLYPRELRKVTLQGIFLIHVISNM